MTVCTEAAATLPGPPGAAQTKGCVATFEQTVTDPAERKRLGAEHVTRRYVVYAPDHLPSAPVPLVFVFPGYGASAEAAAFYYAHLRFEELADRDGFVVVYGNGLDQPPPGVSPEAALENGGYLQGCLAEHAGEGIDVRYTREILAQLARELRIDPARVYATGLSAGGGMAFQLALEAPDLVAAIAPVAPLPFQPSGAWLHHCNLAPGHERVPILMLAATSDRLISYEPGSSAVFPNARYPGMEATRDAWLRSMGITGDPELERLPDLVDGDSYTPHSGVTSSYIEHYSYPIGPDGQEFRYYKAVGMGHWWPHPKQLWHRLWGRFGKTNQDIDFADHAWRFFQRHAKQ